MSSEPTELSLVVDPPMDPALQLAREEALLEGCDAGELPGMLRFWEPEGLSVVVGYANSVVTEAHLAACDREGVPVLRRCSGGGTVLQMPGVLNYTVVMPVPADGALSTVGGTNTWMMDRLRQALSPLEGLGDRLWVRGVTDLCLDERKCVGSAQRRKRAALLFHGSILLDAPLALMERYLAFPSQQPDYRHDRSHLEFCCNLGKTSGEVKEAILSAWNIRRDAIRPALDRTERLVEERYGRNSWHRKW